MKKMFIPHQDKILLVNHEDIVWCQADNCYAVIHLLDGRRLTITRTLKKVEEDISSTKFLRVSQSSLVNIDHLQSIGRKEKTICLINNHQVQYTIQLKKLMEIISNNKSIGNAE